MSEPASVVAARQLAEEARGLPPRLSPTSLQPFRIEPGTRPGKDGGSRTVDGEPFGDRSRP